MTKTENIYTPEEWFYPNPFKDDFGLAASLDMHAKSTMNDLKNIAHAEMCEAERGGYKLNINDVLEFLMALKSKLYEQGE